MTNLPNLAKSCDASVWCLKPIYPYKIFKSGFPTIWFTLSDLSMHDECFPPPIRYNIIMVLTSCKGMLFWFHLPHPSWYMALAKYSQAWLCKAGCSQKKGCFQTSQKSEQHALWMLQPYQKTCYSSALTNKNATVYLQSVRQCSVSPPLLADLCELLHLKTIPHIADPSPGYHWYFGRKAVFFFTLDWVGYMVQSPTWQFQNGDQPFGFKYERKVLALFTPTCLLNIFLVLWLGRIVCIFLFIPLILKL